MGVVKQNDKVWIVYPNTYTFMEQNKQTSVQILKYKMRHPKIVINEPQIFQAKKMDRKYLTNNTRPIQEKVATIRTKK